MRAPIKMAITNLNVVFNQEIIYNKNSAVIRNGLNPYSFFGGTGNKGVHKEPAVVSNLKYLKAD